MLAEDLLKSNPEVIKILYNKFYSAIAFKPTLATILMPEVGHRLRDTHMHNGAYPLSLDTRTRTRISQSAFLCTYVLSRDCMVR